MKYLDFSGLSHFWEKAKAYIATAISTAVSELKSGLKLEDITDVTATAAEVNHLDGVKSNVQEQIDAKAPTASPTFTGVPNAPTASSGSDNEQIANTAYVKQEVDAAKAAIKSELASALTYKGTKDTYEELPSSDNNTGDVWNVVAKHGNTPAGTNYAWDGTKWDALGGDIDLSNYVTNDDLETITTTEIDGLFA